MFDLWTEKYRPKSVDDFVWASTSLRKNVDGWIAAGQTPNVLFSGGAGRGKTSLARLLLRELKIPAFDVLDINASLARKVDEFTEMVTNFTSTWALGDSQMKYVILDEADRLSPLSQDFLRHEMEAHHQSCRFLLTCNHRHKITEALHSRVQEFEFSAMTRDEAALRVAQILIDEKIDFEPNEMLRYLDAYHPDLRKCINVLQQRCEDGKLSPFDSSDQGADYLLVLLTELVSGQSSKARDIIRNQVAPDDYLSVYRFIYTNIEVFDGVGLQDAVLVAIRDGMWRHSTVGDTEINIATTMTEIASLARKQ